MSRAGSCRVSAAHSRSIWLNQLTSAMAGRFSVEIAANDTPSDFGRRDCNLRVESEYADAVDVLVNDASGESLGVQLPLPHDVNRAAVSDAALGFLGPCAANGNGVTFIVSHPAHGGSANIRSTRE